MSDQPARLVRVTSTSSRSLTTDLYALDGYGVLWNFTRAGYATVWERLPPRPGVIDLYTHFKWDYSDCGGVSSIGATLRVLDDAGKLWELRYIALGGGEGEYVWDEVSLEAR